MSSATGSTKEASRRAKPDQPAFSQKQDNSAEQPTEKEKREKRREKREKRNRLARCTCDTNADLQSLNRNQPPNTCFTEVWHTVCRTCAHRVINKQTVRPHIWVLLSQSRPSHTHDTHCVQQPPPPQFEKAFPVASPFATEPLQCADA